MHRRTLLAGLLAPAIARAATPLRLGVLTSLSGPAADSAGPGSVLAARLAIEDRPDLHVKLLVGDIGASPDIGAALARSWYDQGVHAIVDVPNSATALAVKQVAEDRNRAVLFSGAGSTALLAHCSPNSLQWTYNTRALAVATATAVLAEGGRSWFFLTADYTFGHALQADVTTVLDANGGTIAGAARFPADMQDFSALLLQAQASGADVIALACTGGPFESLVKQAAEFQIQPRQRLASLLCFETNVHAIGLDAAQGLLVAAPFYWNANEGSRAFAARMMPRNRGIAPTFIHAGVYSAVTHWLAAAFTTDPADGRAVVARMKSRPATDPVMAPGDIRPDGSVARPMTLYRVRPGGGRAPWDDYAPLRSVMDAFGAPNRCPA